MGKFFLLSFLFFILGLFFAYRLISVISQKSTLPEFGPIDIEVMLETTPKISDQFQIIKISNLTFFADIYPRFQTGDVLKIVGKANSEGLVFRPEIKKVGRESSILTNLADLRQEISRRVDAMLPSREATLVKGMVLGVDAIDKSFREHLIATGTIHVVVVSGQNLSIVAGFFLVLVKYIGRRLSMSLSIAAVLFYAGLTGFEVPVVRALIMVILSYCAVFLGRERLAIWYLVLSAAIIIFIWPSAIFDVSFQLTFAATLGIMTLGRRMSEYAGPVSGSSHPTSSLALSMSSRNSGLQSKSGKGWVRALDGTPSATATRKIIFRVVIQNAAVATSAYLFTAPIIFFHFGQVSLIAPLVNVLVAEAVVPIMLLGFGLAISSLIFMPFAQILAYLAYVPAFYFVKVVEIFSKLT